MTAFDHIRLQETQSVFVPNGLFRGITYSANRLVSNRFQAITWTNDDLVH